MRGSLEPPAWKNICVNKADIRGSDIEKTNALRRALVFFCDQKDGKSALEPVAILKLVYYVFSIRLIQGFECFASTC